MERLDIKELVREAEKPNHLQRRILQTCNYTRKSPYVDDTFGLSRVICNFALKEYISAICHLYIAKRDSHHYNYTHSSQIFANMIASLASGARFPCLVTGARLPCLATGARLPCLSTGSRLQCLATGARFPCQIYLSPFTPGLLVLAITP